MNIIKKKYYNVHFVFGNRYRITRDNVCACEGEKVKERERGSIPISTLV